MVQIGSKDQARAKSRVKWARWAPGRAGGLILAVQPFSSWPHLTKETPVPGATGPRS
jgi:hypothetical protein